MGLSSKQVSSDHQLDHFNWTQNMLTSSASAAADDTSTTTIQLPPSSSSNHRSMKRPLQQSGDLAAAAANLKCPRCDSTNTKFCYYNNYNKTQPRHFCKGCKRHWTKGGTLRNVPVGGARKNNHNRRNVKQRSANNNNTTTTTTVDHKSLGTLIGDHQKYIFPPDDKGLFFKPNDSSEFDQVSWDFNTTMLHDESSTHHQNLGYRPLTSIDHHINPNNIPMMMIPTSFAPLLSSSDLIKDDSTVTTTTTSRMISMIPNSSSSESAYMQQQQQQVPLITTSNFLEPSYWSTCWNDIDSMVGAADLNKPTL